MTQSQWNNAHNTVYKSITATRVVHENNGRERVDNTVFKSVYGTLNYTSSCQYIMYTRRSPSVIVVQNSSSPNHFVRNVKRDANALCVINNITNAMQSFRYVFDNFFHVSFRSSLVKTFPDHLVVCFLRFVRVRGNYTRTVYRIDVFITNSAVDIIYGTCKLRKKIKYILRKIITADYFQTLDEPAVFFFLNTLLVGFMCFFERKEIKVFTVFG